MGDFRGKANSNLVEILSKDSCQKIPTSVLLTWVFDTHQDSDSDNYQDVLRAQARIDLTHLDALVSGRSALANRPPIWPVQPPKFAYRPTPALLLSSILARFQVASQTLSQYLPRVPKSGFLSALVSIGYYMIRRISIGFVKGNS